MHRLVITNGEDFSKTLVVEPWCDWVIIESHQSVEVQFHAPSDGVPEEEWQKTKVLFDTWSASGPGIVATIFPTSCEIYPCKTDNWQFDSENIKTLITTQLSQVL